MRTPLAFGPVWSWPGAYVLPRPRGGDAYDPCPDCGLPHATERRLAILRRCAGWSRAEIFEAWAHFWPLNAAGKRALHRDLAALARRP